MDRRNLFKGALAGALAFVGSRRLAAAEAIPGETLELETSDWVQVLPDTPVGSWGYGAPGEAPIYEFHLVPDYGWKEMTGTGILVPESGEYWDHDTILRRVALARSFRRNYVEQGVVTGPDEFGNWFVPNFSIMYGGHLTGPDEFGNWFVPAQGSFADHDRVLVRDHGVLAGAPSQSPFLFRWDWVTGNWVLNRESWTEDQV